MRKIKILQFSIGNVKGGVTQYVLLNWKFIDKSKFQFDFATMSPSLDYEEELKEQGCKIHYLSCYAEDNKKQFTKEFCAILDEGYDVIHLHTNFWHGFLIEQISLEYKIPVIIVHAHNTGIGIQDEEKRRQARKNHEEQKRLFSAELATHFCACSGLASDWIFGKQIPRDKIKVLKYGIDTSLFSYSPKLREQYREEFNVEGCFVIGHIGRFSYQKNHDMLIDIFKQVCDNIENARLMLAGVGELMDLIKRKAREYGILDKIIFLGKREDVPALMQAMDVFCLPSRFEGFGIVLIEAQATGLKCLVSQAVPEEAKITSNIKYLSEDTKVWSKELLRLANEGYERIDGKKQVEEAGYSVKETIRQVERIYEYF